MPKYFVQIVHCMVLGIIIIIISVFERRRSSAVRGGVWVRVGECGSAPGLRSFGFGLVCLVWLVWLVCWFVWLVVWLLWLVVVLSCACVVVVLLSCVLLLLVV